MIAILFSAIALKILLKIFSQQSTLLIKFDKIFGYKIIIELVEAIQLDIYVGCLIAIITFSPNSFKSDINLFCSLILLLIAGISLLVFWYVTGKVYRSYEKPEEQNRYSDANYYENFKFITKDYKMKHIYQIYYRLFLLLKEPLLAFGIVILYSYPAWQIGVSAVITLVYLMLDIYYLPFTSKSKNINSLVQGSLYFICDLLYFVLHIVKDRIEVKYQYYFLGYGIIFVLVVLIIFSISRSMIGTFVGIVKFFGRLFTKCGKNKIGNSTKKEIEDSQVAIKNSKNNNGNMLEDTAEKVEKKKTKTINSKKKLNMGNLSNLKRIKAKKKNTNNKPLVIKNFL